ncbi:MAG: lytic transglycosylase domain-containing protein [Rhodospirillales bacterium]|nr:lytic transglycosylase domain-containing protein [Rhodospirillales bacterium]
MQLERRLFPRGGYDSAAYPIPHWVPEGDFIADRALIYAVIRQESQFNPRAISRAGARGVMQLMPGTAQLVARRLGSGDAGRWADPEVNIKLGQSYIAMLLGDPNVGGDLFRLAAAWNGGPGNLDRWQRGVAATDDPLLFIESIPYRETRDFVEKVLANLWIYRDRLGQVDPSLDMLAAGEWPTYIALDRSTIELAHWRQDD